MATYRTKYEDERERLKILFDEAPSDDDNIGGGSDVDDMDCVEEEDHDSASEQELSEDDGTSNDSDNKRNSKLIYGRDGTTVWSKTPFHQGIKAYSRNTFLNTISNHIETPIDSWSLLFTFIDEIVNCTNIYINKICNGFNCGSDSQTTDAIEINALIGLLYLAGIQKPCRTNIKDLWATDGTGLEIFYATISYNRFLFLMRCIRFDDVGTRQERIKNDKLAPIRKIYNEFNENITKSYNCSKFVTIDEKLEEFHEQCRFRQYMPNKPGKYGIKMFCVVDNCSYYTTKLDIYCGTQPPGPYQIDSNPVDVVKRNTAHLQNCGRNITADNWFTSYQLCKNLLTKKTTIVGAIKKDKMEIPRSFINSKNLRIKSTLFGFQKTITLLSYVPKKNKSMLVLSSLHHDGKMTKKNNQLPEAINFYNSTKNAVDTTVKLCAKYNVARKTKRWPLVIFYDFMNIAGINARIILLSTENPKLQYKSRKIFLKDLALDLMENHINRHAKISTSPLLKTSSINFTPNKIKENEDEPLTDSAKQPKRGRVRCKLCTTDRRSSTACIYCKRFMCRDHTAVICVKCSALTKIEEIDDEPKKMRLFKPIRARCEICKTDRKTSSICMKCERYICREHNSKICVECVDNIYNNMLDSTQATHSIFDVTPSNADFKLK